MSRRKWTGRFVYLFYLVVVSMAFFELGGRFIWVTDGEYLYPRSQQIFVFDRNLNYRIRADFSIAGEENRLYPGVGLRINQGHMRGVEPDARDTIIIVGDSVVFGFGVRESDTMSVCLEKHLGHGLQVLNAGTPGYNMEQIALRTRELVEQVRPRTVILLVNANDGEARYFLHHAGLTLKRFYTYPWEKDQYPPEVELRVDPTDHWFSPRVFSVLGGEWPVRTQVVDSPPRTEKDAVRHLAYEERQLTFWNSDDPEARERTGRAMGACRSLVDDLTARGIQVVVTRFPWSVTVLKPAVKDGLRKLWLSALKPSPGMTVIDLQPYLAEAQKREPQFLPADGHPNAAGHDTIAHALKDGILR